jgi:HEAT repeat protein
VFATLLQAPDPLVREFAAGGLARLGDGRQVETLKRALHGQDVELALEAARLLSSVQPHLADAAATVLHGALTDRDEVVRANAVYALSEMPVPEWSEAEAIRALADDSALVRSAALEVLPSVQAKPHSKDWPLGVLARRWDAERIAAVRLEILNTIAELGLRRAAPASDVARFAALVMRHETDERVRIAAEGMLAVHDARAAKRLLVLAADSGRGLTERLLALSLLGRSCSGDVLAPLAGLVDQPGGAALDRDALRVGAAAAWLRLAGSLEGSRCGGMAPAA